MSKIKQDKIPMTLTEDKILGNVESLYLPLDK